MIILVSETTTIFDKIDLRGKKKIAFIPNAKDKHKDKYSLEKYKAFFQNKGFVVKDVDLNAFKKDELYKELQKHDIIFVAGGNCFVLLEKIRKSGFDKIINKLLDKGVIYIGQSAGACVMGKSIEPIKLMDNPEISGISDYDGLGFVDFVFIPHYKNPKYQKTITEIEKIYDKKFNLEKFTDKEGIIIDKGIIRKI